VVLLTLLLTQYSFLNAEMSEEWMTTSFFPLLPFNPDESPTVTPEAPVSMRHSYSSGVVTAGHSPSSSTPTSSTEVALAGKILGTTSSTACPTGSGLLGSDVVGVLAVPPVSSCASSASTVSQSDTGNEGAQLTASEMAMFNKIIASGCVIKSQQRGEPDLSHGQLCDELAKCLRESPSSYLMRYGRYLDSDDLSYFAGVSERNDYEVNFRLERLRRTLSQSSKSRSKRVKNRRYECLRKLMEETSYFSEEEMRQRNPLLYDFYIGQYQSKEEKERDERKNADMSLSSMILNQMDQNKTAELLRWQRRNEMAQLSSDVTALDAGPGISKPKVKTLKAMELNSDPIVAEREKLMLRREFLSAMQTHFLEGKDEGFDYSKVDMDESYDSIDMREKDEQDSYFDEEEPSWWEGGVECEGSNMDVT